MTTASGAIKAAVAAYESTTGTRLSVGQTIHVNHEGCAAGTDARRRLYITRKRTDAGNTVDLAFCHNCGRGARSAEGTPNARALVTVYKGAAAPPAPLELPDNLVLAGTEGFPAEAEEFLQPITQNYGPRSVPIAGEWGWEDTHIAGIGFNRDNGRLLLPIYDSLTGEFGAPIETGTLLGWQERRLYGNGPKYLTTDNGDPLETTVRLWAGQPELIVFTEDYLSAIRVAQTCPAVMAVPLLRYKVRAERVAELAKTRLPAVVWLDNDRPEVKDEGAHLERLWRALGNKAAGTGSTIEPKKCIHGLKWISKYINERLGEMS